MNQSTKRHSAIDVQTARRELISTVEEVALYLLGQTWQPQVLLDLSADIDALSLRLREIASRHMK